MIFHAKMPLNFWAEAVNTAVYLHNRSPTSSLTDGTPYEHWFGQKPNVSNLKIFGSICFVHTPDNLRRKLDPKSRKAIFVGYLTNTKGYKVYDLESKNFVRSRNVLFHENKFHGFEIFDKETVLEQDDVKGRFDEDGQCTVIPGEPTVNPVTANHEENVPAVGATFEENFVRQVENIGSTRQRKPPERFRPDECHVAESLTADNEDPQCIEEALKGKHSDKWKQALEAEYNSLIDNETWELVPPPESSNIVGSKWVLKTKRDANGNINRHKARLVAQGYSQKQEVDYEEVFSPVARYSSIRTLLALANAQNLEVLQMDVKTAFLNGSIKHDIYVSQPEGFIDPDHPEYVCKLKKSIYGLKQSARCWNQTLDSFLIGNGYQKSGADNCIYVKSKTNADGFISFVTLAIYVDDIIPVSNDVEMLNKEKDSLCKEFEMVDLGEIHFVLGMSVKRDRANKVLFINQEKYLESVLNRFGMQDCKPVSTPLEPGVTFHKRLNDEEPCDKHVYQQAIGCLTYVSTATRPDIAAAVSILSTFMSDPSKEHWTGIKRLLRYIKGTLNFGLKFRAHGDEELYGYSDANWAGDVDTRRSTSGYVFKIADSTISWSSRTQATVAKSTTEAEYVSLSQATQEAIWMRQLLSVTKLTNQLCCTRIIKEQRFHSRTKHIDITFHFIRERISSNEINMYCESDSMLADIMTKGLSKIRFEKLRYMLGVCTC